MLIPKHIFGKNYHANCVACYLIKCLILFVIGGFVYMGIELLWRQYTHWSMGIVGGLCFVLIGLINEVFTYEMYIELQAVIGAVVVTVIEFIAGCIVNIGLGWNVWDYSNLQFNILGQVSLLFSFFWIILSFVAIYIDDILRDWLFNEPRLNYTWWIPKILKKKKEWMDE